MKAELKGVKINRGLSQETTAFSATLWLDGKPAAEVLNHGTGGSNILNFTDWGLRRKFDAYCGSLPPDDGLAMDADFFVSLLLERWEFDKLLSTHTVFHLKDKTYRKGEYTTIKEKFSPELKAWLVKEYGDKLGRIFNEGG